MPIVTARPRRSSNNRRSAPVTPTASDARPLSAYDANSVSDRIRQWQAETTKLHPLADPALSDEIAGPAPNHMTIYAEAGSSPPTSRDQKRQKQRNSAPKRRTSRRVDPGNVGGIRESRSNSTPRKRVISDEHWKKTRLSLEPRSRASTPKRDLRYDGKYRDNWRPQSPTVEATIGGKPQRKQRRSTRNNGEAKLAASSLNGEEASVSAPSTNSRRYSGEHVSMLDDTDLRSNTDHELARVLGSIQFPHPTHVSKGEELEVFRHKGNRRRQRSLYADALDKHTDANLDSSQGPVGSAKPRKGSIFNQAKDMFSRSEAPVAPSMRLPSIEAWLAEQPDPFVDDDTSPIEVPAPLQTRSRRRKLELADPIPQDPNRIWDTLKVEGAEDKPSRSNKQHEQRKSMSGRRKSNKYLRRDDTFPDAAVPSPESLILDQEFMKERPRILKDGGAKLSTVDKAVSRDFSFESRPASETLGSSVPSIHREVPQSSSNCPNPSVKQCPPTGLHQLSTIASVETFRSRPVTPDDSAGLPAEPAGIERQQTRHDDRMSVLSSPRAGKSLRSPRSTRSLRGRIGGSSLEELLEGLRTEEAKYSRELRTLVDGVIPVLLQCVLSKSDSVTAAGLFTSSSSAKDDLNFTKPIIDMGIALERLRTLHSRIPTHNTDFLLSWALSATTVYSEYLKAWRLGFQDVVVNLAPAEDGSRAETDQGMARDSDGDVINEAGKKVDVAYLLKRPLVRIKNLGKFFKQLATLRPSDKGQLVASQCSDLVLVARKRSNEEQGRLEDEAAANIESSKARDLRTLAVLRGVTIDKSRRVRARDCFNLTLHHSTGQRIDCRVELLLRDDLPGLGPGGDILLCEVEDSGRWLFFPPIDTRTVSARTGDTDSHLVVMIRGPAGFDREWHEMISLKADDRETALEWRSMLGSDPLPPKLIRSPSFISREQDLIVLKAPHSSTSVQALLTSSLQPPASDVEVPIGEPSIVGAQDDERPYSAPSGSQLDKPLPSHTEVFSPPQLNLSDERHASLLALSCQASYSPPVLPTDTRSKTLSPTKTHIKIDDAEAPPQQQSGSGLQRTGARKGRRKTSNRENSPHSPVVQNFPTHDSEPTSAMEQRKLSRTDQASREWMANSGTQHCRPSDLPPESQFSQSPVRGDPPSARPRYDRALSSTPSKELPTISRIRPTAQGSFSPDVSASSPLNDSTRGRWAALSGDGDKDETSPKKPGEDYSNRPMSHPGMPFTEDVPPPPPHRDRSRSPSPAPPSPTDRHTSTAPAQDELAPRKPLSEMAPVLQNKREASPMGGKHAKRRPSSPLKHEYAPSATSDSHPEYETDARITASTSTSEEEMSEIADRPTPLVSIPGRTLRRSSAIRPPASLPALPPSTLAPSNSASQAPYRSVPAAAARSNTRTPRKIATIWSWADHGKWERLYPSICSIVISPGLISAYVMTEAHSGNQPDTSERSRARGETFPQTSDNAEQEEDFCGPLLVAQELTPLVPLRRGTALDISIRSPPTEDSKIRCSNNIMFRSRSPEECEALYALINHARINNPTYIALQNARPSYQPHVTFNTGIPRPPGNSSRSRPVSWFGMSNQGKRSSYRASSAPSPSAPSVGVASVDSVGTMNNALSALRRFSGGTAGGRGIFNINRSSVVKRKGRFGTAGCSSLYSSSSGTTGTGGYRSGPASPAPSQRGLQTVPESSTTQPADGAALVNNLKVRLYTRVVGASWQALGSACLTIFPGPESLIPSTTDGTSTPPTADPSQRGPSTAPFSGRDPSLSLGQSSNTTMMSVTSPPTSRDTGPRLPSSQHTPHRIHGDGREKRILISAKSNPHQVLLDEVLGESCFEHSSRTSIAVSVWKEDAHVGDTGGVIAGRTTVYMIQLRSEAEAGWIFGLLGRFRY